MAWNNEKLMKKSRLAPLSISFRESYFTMSEKYARMLLVTALPKEFTLGLLSQYVGIPDIKMQIVTNPMKLDCASLLRKEYNDKLRNYENTTDPHRRGQLEADLRSLNNYIEEIITNNDITQNIIITFTITADDLERLDKLTASFKSSLQSQGFQLFSAKFMQENIHKATSPLYLNSGLSNVIEENLGVPLPSAGLAGLYPFVFETLKDTKGFILGHEYTNHGVILFDQFLWKNERDQATLQNRTSGNMVIVGSSGSGKTTLMKLLIRNYIRTKKTLIWIDPENKNQNMTKKYGGDFISFGKKGNLINIFDLKPVSVDEDEDASIMWDTETAIYNVIDDVKITLRYLSPSISDDTLAILGDVVIRTYQNAGITFQRSFKGTDTEDMPIFSDFDEAAVQMIEEYSSKIGNEKIINLLNDLRLKIKPILNEYSIYFNGHTTIRANESERGIISFGTKILFQKPDALKNALYRIMYQYAWSLCLDETKDSAFVLDEASTQVLDVITAPLIGQFVRRSRKYNNVTVLGTQEPKDFAVDQIIVHGKAMFNSSPYKLFMHLEKDAIEDCAKLTTLNENERQFIEDCHQGDALFVCGDRRIPIHIIPTENELSEM